MGLAEPDALVTLGISFLGYACGLTVSLAGRVRARLDGPGLEWISTLDFRPESRQDYPPNLSILISGGKENNCDALSNGE